MHSLLYVLSKMVLIIDIGKDEVGKKFAEKLVKTIFFKDFLGSDFIRKNFGSDFIWKF